MCPGEYYHIFNYSNGFENLFNDRKNYIFFLDKLQEYVLPVCRIFAFSLTPDHYRLVVQVRDKEELCEYFSGIESLEIIASHLFLDDYLERKISKCFSNMFNSYAQSYNKWNGRLGSLFMQNMRKEIIQSVNEFRNIIYDTHIEPVELGLTRKINEWPYSSYFSLTSYSPTYLDKEFVLDVFGGIDLFVHFHQRSVRLKLKG